MVTEKAFHRNTQKHKTIKVVVIGIIGLVALIAGIFIIRGAGGQAKEVTTEYINDRGGVYVDVNGAAVKEPSGEPVIEIWSDYTCPGCQALDQLFGDTFKDHQGSQLSVHPVSILGTTSGMNGAVGLLYIAENSPEDFWVFNQAMFVAGKANPNMDPVAVTKVAENVGVDGDALDQMTASINSDDWRGLVPVDTFYELGYTGTPSLVVDGVLRKDWFDNPTTIIPAMLAGLQTQ